MGRLLARRTSGRVAAAGVPNMSREAGDGRATYRRDQWRVMGTWALPAGCHGRLSRLEQPDGQPRLLLPVTHGSWQATMMATTSEGQKQMRLWATASPSPSTPPTTRSRTGRRHRVRLPRSTSCGRSKQERVSECYPALRPASQPASLSSSTHQPGPLPVLWLTRCFGVEKRAIKPLSGCSLCVQCADRGPTGESPPLLFLCACARAAGVPHT